MFKVPDGYFVTEGIVKTVGRGQIFIVESVINGKQQNIVAYLAGKLKKYRIKVMRGDAVKVLIPHKNTEHGRIIYRYK